MLPANRLPSTGSIVILLVGSVAVAPAALGNVIISEGQTQNISCSNGICVPSEKKAVLNVGDLENLLATGDVVVRTTGSSIQAGNIEVNSTLTWSSTGTLSFDALGSIAVSKPISVAGVGGLMFTTNDGGSGGTLSFGPKGSAGFANLGSALTINGMPYVLENSLATLASAILANPGGNYALANSYDASSDGTYPNCPIDTTLNGTLQGLGNSISNISIDARPMRGVHPFAALLELVGASGAVNNLRLENIDYRGIAVAGLAAGSEGALFGDSVTGVIKSRRDSAAGLVQGNGGDIISSSARVRVNVGCCKSGEGLAGGLVVYNYGTISLSHADGDVSGSVGSGGLVTVNQGAVSESYATGNVNGGGGLVDANFGNGGTISNSYSTGEVKGGSSGGLVGNDDYTGATISDSYSSGAVFNGSGGFVCTYEASNLDNDYWDMSSSGTDYAACDIENVTGITGLTTQQLQASLPLGFDPKIWAENSEINNGLPYLINNQPTNK
jgi:hypothetical protein